MAKEQIDATTAEIRSAIEKKTVIFGTKRALKALRNNAVAKIFVTINAPQEVRTTVDYYSQLNNVATVTLDKDNEELGILCKRPHIISILAIAKEQ